MCLFEYLFSLLFELEPSSPFMMMNAKDLKAKQSLAKATESVRNKYQELRSAHLENKRLLEEQYKPITKRLGNLIDLNK